VSVTARDQTNVSLPRYRVKTKRGLVCGAQQLPISPCFLRPSIMSDRRESTASLPQDFGGRAPPYDDEDAEKQPLTGGNVPAGFYPPG
jgi:hypothetical protein